MATLKLPQMMSNFPLSAVTINAQVSKRWNDAASVAAIRLIESGVAFSVSDERVSEIAGGRLEIFVDMPSGERVSVVAEPDEWAWRGTK